MWSLSLSKRLSITFVISAGSMTGLDVVADPVKAIIHNFRHFGRLNDQARMWSLTLSKRYQ